MSATALMGVSTQALFSAYKQVSTIGNNIANANTEGYSRQTAVQTTSMSLLTGSGWVGTGSQITDVVRASNLFLQEKTNTLTSVASAALTRRDLLGQLEKAFQGGAAGMGNAVTQVFNAFSDLAINPSDLSARQAVLGRLEEMAALARSSGQQLQMLQDNVQSDMEGAVAEVNTVAKQIAALNREIQNASAQGFSPNNLLDQRDQLVTRLTEQMDLQTYTQADGSMSVFVASGQPLVLGDVANALQVRRDELDPTRSSISVSIQGKVTLVSDKNITGGKLGGLISFQNDDLLASRNRLGQLVTSVAVALNEQQAWGIDLNSNAGAPLFELAPPQALAAKGNALDAMGRPLTSVTLEIEDASALQASDYELEADASAPGSYILTRLSDGLRRTGVVSGDVVDGLRITDGASAPTAGERFLLRAVAQVPATITLALRDPKGLAAAGPMVATVDPLNQGTLSVAAVDVVADPTGPYAALSLRFTDDLGAYELLDGGGSVLGSGQFTAGQPIVVDNLSLQVTGVPRTGDQLSLAPITHPGSNNGNALTFANLAERKLTDGQVATEAYAALFTDIGVRSQGAIIRSDSAGAAVSAAREALSGHTGVNLDEEAARLIQFQQSYQAAAKVLQAAQNMLDTVLGLAQ